MNTIQALNELGAQAHTLTGDESERLDRDGYLPLRNVFTPDLAEKINRRMDELLSVEGDRAGLEVHQEAGTERLADLINKSPLFDITFICPRVLAAIAHVLRGDLKLSSLNARFALPGQGLQHLHADWHAPVADGGFQVCNSIWLLDDFTEENGATRVVPGSHKSGQMPQDVMKDPAEGHPMERLLLGKVGDVVVFNSHTWHGGTLNRTDRRRRAMHAYFCRRDQAQQLDQRKYITTDTLARLSVAARYILDVLD